MTEVRLRTTVSSVREVSPGAELPYVALEHVESMTGAFVQGYEPGTKATTAEVVFRRGDVLFGKLRPYLAKVIAPDVDGCASGEFLVLRPRPSMDSRFLYYLCLSRPLLDWAVATSVGTKMPRTDWEQLSSFHFRLPSFSQQRAIRDFLDRETARIDRIIERRKELRSLLWSRWESELHRAVTKGLDYALKLISSGLEWAGEIPSDWRVPSVYAGYDVQLGKMLNPERAAGPDPAPYLRNVNVQWDRFDLNDLARMSFDDADRVKYALRPGDLLVCEGGEVGRAAIWQGQLDECYFQKAIHRVRPRGENSARFLMYAIWAAASMNVFNVEGNQATIVHLTAEKLRAHRFPMPPRKEQEAIVDYLDRRQAVLRRVTSQIEQQVYRLREHRHALITSAVTGQLNPDAYSMSQFDRKL